jgi:hypothetical protein
VLPAARLVGQDVTRSFHRLNRHGEIPGGEERGE